MWVMTTNAVLLCFRQAGTIWTNDTSKLQTREHKLISIVPPLVESSLDLVCLGGLKDYKQYKQITKRKHKLISSVPPLVESSLDVMCLGGLKDKKRYQLT